VSDPALVDGGGGQAASASSASAAAGCAGSVAARAATSAGRPAPLAPAAAPRVPPCPLRPGSRARRPQPLAHPQPADDTVLVEAPAPVGAAVVGAAHATDLGAAALRGDPGGGVDRVVVGEAADDLGRVDRLLPVQGEEVLAPRAQ